MTQKEKKKSSFVTSHGLFVLLWLKVSVYRAEGCRPSAVLVSQEGELPPGEHHAM